MLLPSCSGLLFVLARTRRPEIQRSIALGQTARGDTSRPEGRFRPRCGEPRERDGDQAWTFTAPTAGAYRFRVLAEHSAAVAVFHRDGWGEEIACAEQGPRDDFAAVSAALEARVEYVIVVDGVRGETGPYRLVAERDDGRRARATTAVAPESAAAMLERCQRAPLITAAITQSSITPGASVARVSCGGGGRGPERVFRLQLDDDALVEATVTSAFDAVIELRSGCSAGATAMACNDDAPDARRASIRAPLPAGEYYVIVDSFWEHDSGPFELSVSMRYAHTHDAQSPAFSDAALADVDAHR